MNWKTEWIFLKTEIIWGCTGIPPAKVKKKVPTPQVLDIEFWPLWRWNGLIWSVRSVLSPKMFDLVLLFWHSITSSIAHLAAWWAISALRHLSWGTEEEGRTLLPINNLYFSWVWFLTYFTFFGFVGYFLFQEKRGEGPKRNPTRLNNQWTQGQTGRDPFSTKACLQWAQ